MSDDETLDEMARRFREALGIGADKDDFTRAAVAHLARWRLAAGIGKAVLPFNRQDPEHFGSRLVKDAVIDALRVAAGEHTRIADLGVKLIALANYIEQLEITASEFSLVAHSDDDYGESLEDQLEHVLEHGHLPEDE